MGFHLNHTLLCVISNNVLKEMPETVMNTPAVESLATPLFSLSFCCDTRLYVSQTELKVFPFDTKLGDGGCYSIISIRLSMLITATPSHPIILTIIKCGWNCSSSLQNIELWLCVRPLAEAAGVVVDRRMAKWKPCSDHQGESIRNSSSVHPWLMHLMALAAAALCGKRSASAH